MRMSPEQARDLYVAIGRAYYSVAVARALAEDLKQDGIEEDLQAIIGELLRVRATIYTRPWNRAQTSLNVSRPPRDSDAR